MKNYKNEVRVRLAVNTMERNRKRDLDEYSMKVTGLRMELNQYKSLLESATRRLKPGFTCSTEISEAKNAIRNTEKKLTKLQAEYEATHCKDGYRHKDWESLDCGCKL